MVYDWLAPIYDRIMGHVEYDEWAELIERIAGKYFSSGNPSICELGGGTGVLGSLLMQRGFRYHGSDRSFSMCRTARNRGVPFACADARAIPHKTPFDLAIFLYDGINYLQTLDDYSVLFSEVWRCLAPDGYFLFDITTEANSLRHFARFIEFDDWGDYAYVRRSYYNKEQSRQHNDFTIFRQITPDSQLYERLIERHDQKIFGAGAIARAVPASLFTVEGIWDGFSFRPYRPHSERIHFFLQKRPP